MVWLCPDVWIPGDINDCYFFTLFNTAGRCYLSSGQLWLGSTWALVLTSWWPWAQELLPVQDLWTQSPVAPRSSTQRKGPAQVVGRQKHRWAASFWHNSSRRLLNSSCRGKFGMPQVLAMFFIFCLPDVVIFTVQTCRQIHSTVWSFSLRILKHSSSCCVYPKKNIYLPTQNSSNLGADTEIVLWTIHREEAKRLLWAPVV